MNIRNLILILAVSLSMGGCKKAPTDQQFNELMSKAHQTLMNRDSTFESNDKQVQLLLDEAGKTFDVMKAEARQFYTMTQWNTLLRSKSVRNWVAPRLAELSKRGDKEGALAAYYQLVYNPAREKYNYSPEEAALFLNHPAAGEVFRDSVLGTTLFVRFMRTVADEQDKKAELFKLFVPFIDDRLSNDQVLGTVFLFNNALDMDTLVSVEDREALRTSVLRQHERVLPNMKAAGNEADVKKVEGNIAYLNSPIATGNLIGGQAPDIEFLWTSDGKGGRLSDLKGKVVLVDFWTTWCGPCVASFPNVRELQKRYKGYPVEIIGVTSVQGRHIRRNGDKRETVDTKGKPEEEFLLMKEFMKDMDMNWKVAFGATDVFNPMYGVRGIPHVAIIDAEGRVRFNNLRPYDAPFHEAEKIDALLQEAGLKYPAQPMTTENFVK